MPSCCLLDRLPVELFHDVFEYFWAHEILQSFSNVSEHLDDVLHSYSSHRVNLQYILRKNFDLICESIRPDQVISLRLSDEKTIAQSEIFFSRFQLEQFTQLQSLTLVKIEEKILTAIFHGLTNLPHLRSLILKRPESMDQLNITYELLSQLNRLHLDKYHSYDDKSFPNLAHLKLSYEYSLDKIQIMCKQATNLKSLNVIIFMNTLVTQEFLLPLRQLTYLTLKVQNRPNIFISMNNIECLLTNLPCLKHVELHTNGSRELADGQRWQMLTQSLTTFHFNFKIEWLDINEHIDSFRTPFWIHEKQWFVAYYDNYLFSVPYFLNTHLKTPYCHEDFYTTLTDTSVVIDQNIKAVSIYGNFTGRIYHRCNHVETLEMFSSIPIESLLNIFDLNQIKCLTLFSLNNAQALVSLLQAMPRVQKLQIAFISQLNLFEIASRIQFEQIRTLAVHDSHFNVYNIERWCHLFPNVNDLTVGFLESKAELIRLLDGFKYLSYAVFEIKDSCIVDKETEMIIDEVRRLTKATFTYEIVPELNDPTFVSSFNFWLGERQVF